jgi:hypothetical protein
MGMVWAMVAFVVAGGVLFFLAVTTHNWALFALMAVCLTIAAIWGSKGSIPRGDTAHDRHY